MAIIELFLNVLVRQRFPWLTVVRLCLEQAPSAPMAAFGVCPTMLGDLEKLVIISHAAVVFDFDPTGVIPPCFFVGT